MTGVLANPKFLAAVFSADSVDKKRNTEALEIAANQLVSARITQYTPARTLPLTEVRSVVHERLVNSLSAELSKKEGAEKLVAWKRDASAANLPAAVFVSREKGQTITGPLLDAVLRADVANLPAWAGVDLGVQGYAVVRVNKVLARTAVPQTMAKQEREQYAQWIANAESQAYYQLLKERFNVQMKVQRPSHSTNDTQAARE
jgi:peptidyl-prolyl cis-trans isomerase D